MAMKFRVISVFFAFNILLAMAGLALAGRAGPAKHKEENLKKPDCYVEPDGSVNIPNVGRVSVQTPGVGGDDGSSQVPNDGNSGGYSGPQYIPGLDDTFVPNPGYEVPIRSGP